MSTLSIQRSSTGSVAAIGAQCATRLERRLLGIASAITAMVAARIERRAAAHRVSDARSIAEESRRDRAAIAHDGLLPR